MTKNNLPTTSSLCRRLSAAAFAAVLQVTVCAQPIISTVAGNGSVGFGGDGGNATSAQFNWSSAGVFLDSTGSVYSSGPNGVCFDSSGNLYIADHSNHRVRKVTREGIVSTVAGSGTRGFAGDGGSATAAQLSYPSGVAVDSAGNLYIADFGNDRVRKVTTAGLISTVAGTVLPAGFSGDGGNATSAHLNKPSGVAVDGGGNLYIADHGNQRIRKVTPAGVISTLAGNGSAGFSGDDALGTSAQLNLPRGIAVDGGGNVYIADQGNNRIRKVTAAGVISTLAGSGTRGFGGDGGNAISAQLNSPMGVAADSSGAVYIADRGNDRIRKVTPGGLISTLAGSGNRGFSGDGGLATAAQINLPDEVTIDSFGGLYIVDLGNTRIRKVTAPNLSPPAIAAGGVTNGASFRPGIVPGSWVTITGFNLSPVTDNWDRAVIDGKLPDSLDGVSVSIGGKPAYVQFVSPGQINVQAPDVGVGPTPVIVTNPSGVSATFTAMAQQFSPAFFLWNGKYAVATRQDFSPAAQAGLLEGVTTIPAQPGEIIILWATGLGATNPPVAAGIQAPSDRAYLTASPVTVTVGTTNAQMFGAALSPGYAGLYQIGIQIPASTPDGDIPLTAAIGGIKSPDGVFINVQHLPVPRLVSVTPNAADAGASSVALSISGTDLAGARVLFDPPDGISLTSVASSATSATINAAFANSALPGPRSLYAVNSFGESNRLPFTVRPLPIAIRSVTPSSQPLSSEPFQLRIDGSNLSGVTSLVFAPATGITVSNIQAGESSVTATIQLAATALVGKGTVAAKSVLTQSNALPFELTPKILPPIVITSLNPSSLGIGQFSFSLQITGSNIPTDARVEFAPSEGITLAQHGGQGPSTFTADLLSIDATANPGQRTVTLFSPTAGRSNGLPFTIPPRSGNFSITNLRAGPTTLIGRDFSITLTLDYTDPSGAASSGNFNYVLELPFLGQNGVGLQPRGVTPGRTSGTMQLDFVSRNLPSTLRIPTSGTVAITLTNNRGDTSNRLSATYQIQ